MKKRSGYIKKSWGHEVVLLENKDFKVKWLHINPGKSIHLQRHEKKDEMIRVTSGGGIILIANEINERLIYKVLSKDSTHNIHPGDTHKIWANMDHDLHIIEISNNIPDTDVIHLEKFAEDLNKK